MKVIRWMLKLLDHDHEELSESDRRRIAEAIMSGHNSGKIVKGKKNGGGISR